MVASMGPRSEDRGNSELGDLRLGLGAASMGPRSEDRGNPDWAFAGVCGAGLQWGRDLKIAEIPEALKRWNILYQELQWGRDLKIAEIQDLSLSLGRHPRFNGAAI